MLVFRSVSGVVVPATAPAVDYTTKGHSPGHPMAAEAPSVRGVGAALHGISFRSGHVGNFSSLPEDNDVEPYGFTFAHAPLGVVSVVSGARCAVNGNALLGVEAINETVPIQNVKPFNDSKHSSIFVSFKVDNVVQHLLVVSCALPLLDQSVVMRCVFARDVLGEPAPQAFYLCFLRMELIGGVTGTPMIIGRY